MLLAAFSWTVAFFAGLFLANPKGVARGLVLALSAGTAFYGASEILPRLKAAVFTVLIFEAARGHREKGSRTLQVILCTLGPLMASAAEQGPSPVNLAALSCAGLGALWVCFARRRVSRHAEYVGVWFALGVTLGLAIMSGSEAGND